MKEFLFKIIGLLGTFSERIKYHLGTFNTLILISLSLGITLTINDYNKIFPIFCFILIFDWFVLYPAIQKSNSNKNPEWIDLRNTIHKIDAKIDMLINKGD